MDNDERTLEKMLLEHAGKPGSGLAAKNYAVFLSRWEEICAAYEKGWSYSDIWKTLKAEGIFTFSYPAFTSYVRKVKRRKNEAAVIRKKDDATPGAHQSRHEPTASNPSPTKIDMPVFGSEAKQRPERWF